MTRFHTDSPLSISTARFDDLASNGRMAVITDAPGARCGHP